MKHINRKEKMFVSGKGWVQTRKWLSLVLAVAMIVLSVPQTALTVRAEKTTDIVTETAEEFEKTGESFKASETAKGAGEVADSESGEASEYPGGGFMPESEEGTESTVETSEEGGTLETDENTQAVPEESSEAVPEASSQAVPEELSAAKTFIKDYIIYEEISASAHTVRVKGMDRDVFNRHYMYPDTGEQSKPVELTIPARVSSEGVDWNVTEIGEFALAEYKFDEYNKPGSYDTPIIVAPDPMQNTGLPLYISKVTVSPGITKIGKGAFYRSLNINQIDLPGSVTEIGEGAFYFDEGRFNQPPLEVNIPYGVRTIGGYAYHGVFFNGTLTIPNSVGVIGEYAFACDSEVSGIRAAVIPASVEKIHRYAFENATLTRAALYRYDAQLKESVDDNNDGVEYATWMFGHPDGASDKRLTLYVPQELIGRYKSSALSNYFPKLMVRDIYGYNALKESPIRFQYNDADTNRIEMPVPDPAPSEVKAAVKIDMGEDALFDFEDIKWSFAIYESGETLTEEKLKECLSYTLASDGTMNLVFLKLQNYTLTANVNGYFPVYLDIILTGDNPGGPGDDPSDYNKKFLDKVEALTEADIEKMKQISYSPETAFQWDEIRAMAQKITKGRTSDRDKILAVHTWLADYIAYDYDALGYMESDIISEGAGKDYIDYAYPPYDPYEVLKNRYTVCGGYANLAQAMLRSIGIPCAYIGGYACGGIYGNNRIGHAWNMAYDETNKKWIYFDATWDSIGSVNSNSIASADRPAGAKLEWFDFDVAEVMAAGREFRDVKFEGISSGDGNVAKCSYITLFVGEEGKFQALNGYNNVTYQLDGEFKNTDKIELDANGNIKALEPGTVRVIIQNTTADGDISEYGYVRVLKKESFRFKKAEMEVGLNERDQRAICLLNNNYVNRITEMTSSDTSVVTVGEDGTLYPLKTGEAVITAKLMITAAANKPEVSCKVTVVAEKLPTVEDESFQYRVITGPSDSNPGTVEIINCKNMSGMITENASEKLFTMEIPNSVTLDEKAYTVIGIGEGAFSEFVKKSDIWTHGADWKANVTLPDKLQYIEENAFSRYKEGYWQSNTGYICVTVNFPASLQRIEDGAFRDFCLAGNVVFPAGSQLSYIGKYAFKGNGNITKLDASKCSLLQEIGEEAFIVNGKNVFEDSDMSLSEVKLPNGLKTIGAEAFCGAAKLTSIEFPFTLESIGDYAFRCTGLTGAIDISGATALGKAVFTKTKIETVILSDALRKIPDDAFSGYSNKSLLKNVLSKSYLDELGGMGNVSGGIFKLPASVKSIGRNAFSGTALTGTIDISGVSTIGTSAFSDCKELEKVTLSDNLAVIPNQAFSECEALESITFGNAIETIGDKAFYFCTKLGSTTDGAINLGSGIKSIGEEAFRFCEAIKKVTIYSKAIKSVGINCFSSSPELYIYKQSDDVENALRRCVKNITYLSEKMPTSIALDKTTLRLSKDAKEKLTATVNPADAADKSVTWSSSETKVATVGNDGTVTAVGAGTAIITAAASAKDTIKKTCTVTVVDYKISESELKIDLAPTEDKTRTLTITGKAAGDAVTWASDKISVATVSSGGKVTAVGVGSAAITATVKAGGQTVATFTCTVTVTNNTLTAIALSETSCEMKIGDTKTLEVSYTPADTTLSKTVAWTSDTENVATVDDNGKVTARGVGSATITATVAAAEGNTKTAKCVVTVKSVTTKEEADAAAKEVSTIAALTNIHPKLKDVPLPDDKWSWVEGEMDLKLFAGDGTKNFAATYKKDALSEGYVTNLPMNVTTVTGVKIVPTAGIVLNMAGDEPKTDTLSLEWVKTGPGYDMTTLEAEAAWTSSNPAVADVSAASAEKATGNNNPVKGKEVTVTAKKAGSATITLSAKVGGKTPYTAKYTVKVVNGTPVMITVADDGIEDFEFVKESKVENAKPSGYYGEVGRDPNDSKKPKQVTLTATVTDSKTALTVKSSDANVIAAGKATKDKTDNTKYTVPLTIKDAGTADITLTANDAAKTSKTVTLYVTDLKPRISEDIVTVNLQRTEEAEFYLYPHDGYTVTKAELGGDDSGKFDLDVTQPNTPGDNSFLVKVTAKASTAKGTYKKLTVNATVKKDGGQEETADGIPLTIKVVDTKPSYKVSQTGKVNLFYTGSKVPLNISTSEEITGVKLEDTTDSKNKVVVCAFEVEPGTNGDTQYYLKAKDSLVSEAIKKNKGKLTISFEGYKDVTQDYTVGVENKAPGLKLGSNKATFYPNAYTAAIDIMDGRTKWEPADYTGLTVTCYKKAKQLTIDTNFEVTPEGGVLLIKRKAAPTTSGKAELTFSLKKDNWNQPILLNYTVTLKAGNPAPKLSKPTIKLNTGFGTYDAATTVLTWSDGAEFEEANVTVEAKDANAQKYKDNSIEFAYSEATRTITARLKSGAIPKGTYKYEAVVQTNGAKLKTPLNVTIVNDTPAKSISVSSKGTIDVLNREGTFVTVTPTLKAVNGTVEAVELTGNDAHMFKADLIDGKVAITAQDKAKLVTNYYYKVKLVFTIDNGDGKTTKYTTPDIKLKLAQGRPKVTITPANAVFFSGIVGTETLDVAAVLTKAPDLAIEDVELVNFKAEFAPVSYNKETKKLDITSTKRAAKNKTYRLQFKVTFKDQAGNEKPTMVNYSVKVK